MGEVQSCLKEDQIYLKQYVKATNRKRSLAFVTSSGQPLNIKTIKALTKTVFERAFEKGLLTDYKEKFNKFLEDYASIKFIGFLTNFALLAASEKNDAGVSAYRSKLPPKIEVEMRGASINRPRSNSEEESKILKNGTFREKIYNYFEMELVKKENFFLEMARVFSVRFAEKYELEINRFSAILKDVKSYSDLVTSCALTMVEIKNMYKNCLKDIKDFRKVFVQVSNEFLKEIFYNTHKNDSFLLQNARIERLATQIIFERNNLYTLFFTLIRLNHIDDELRLRSVYTKFQTISPKSFNIDDVFALTEDPCPYQSVVESIHNLDMILVPHEKFNRICNMRKEIATCLDAYYDTKERKRDSGDKILLSAESVLPLFSYCIATSKNLKIRAHQVFIEEFVDENLLKFGEEGYSFSTFIAATDYLVSLSSEIKTK